MTDKTEVEENWVIRVTTLVNTHPSKYQNFFIGVKGTKEQAKIMKDKISVVGFKVGGQHFIPTMIKNLTIKRDGEVLNEQ